MNTTNESAGGFPANGLTAAQNAALTAEVGNLITDSYGPGRFLQLLTTLYTNYTRFIIEDEERDTCYTGVIEPAETTGLLSQLLLLLQKILCDGKEEQC